jgi:AraC-like DNA-binding protein
MYEERDSRVPGAVVWRRISTESGVAQRVLSDGCMDVIWAGGELLVAGPDTVAHLVSDPAGARYVGLRFAPGAAPAVLGVPADELRDRRVPLADLWPSAEVRRLSEQAGEAADPGAALELAVMGRAGGRIGADPLLSGVVAMLRDGVPVAAIALEAGVSERQLHRRCLGGFGYGPRTLGRILRMNRAVDLARRGTPYGTVAAVAGYADQAHLSREVKALAGVPLTTLLR